MKRAFVFVAAMILIATALTVAEEAKPEIQPAAPAVKPALQPADQPPPADPEMAKRREMMEKARAIQQKMMNGEEVTEDERKVLNEAREMRGQQFRREVERRVQDFQRDFQGRVQPRNEGRPGQQDRASQKALRHDDRLNVIDSAYYEMAELQIAKQQPQPAIEALEQLLKVTTNNFTAALTHYNIAQICRTKLNNTARAAEEYQKVTGECSLEALEALVQMFEELDKVDDAIAALNKIAAESTDDFQKCVALRKLSELLVKHERHDEAVETLRKLTQAIPYEKAESVTKMFNEEKERRQTREREARQRFQFQPGGEMDRPQRGMNNGEMRQGERRRDRFGEPEMRPQDRPRDNNERLPRGAQPQEAPIERPAAE